MTEITTAGGLIVTAVAVILITTTILLVIATKVIPSASRSRDSSDGGGVPVIPGTSSIVTSSGRWKYDVFLSFRGEDTRKTFVDHLYSALEHHGILTYKDDQTLDRGDTIGPSLLKAIETSQIALVIFSENYADSSWCLDELSHIMKCRDRETGQIVYPIFYHVDPSDIRKQKGKFGKAFAKHNKKKKVESWKRALVDASNIAGWEPNQVANGHEAKCIKEIVGSILDKLSSLDPAVEDEDLVGMGTRLKQLKSQLRIESGGVRMVGIWGVGGGGKTTLATSLYLQISPNFDGCCFLGNIREESSQHGLPNLQEKVLSAVFHKKTAVQSVELGKQTIKHMLSRRNVLIVLDDVDHLDQLKALAGRHDWFGDGSRIIITTRDQHLLTTHRVDVVSPISLLSRDEAIRLFRRHAYCEDEPVQDYETLSQQIVSYAAGLPLALIVLGSFLYDKDNDEWVATLSRLKDHPEMDIVEKLKISYDGLKPVEKELFLDIACFFRGGYKDSAMEMLDACGFHPGIGIKVLKQKALISVSINGQFVMHDLVQEMAHYIVRGEHPNNPEKHTRLWREEDIEDICSRNATVENDKIEAIHLPYCPVLGGLSNFVMLVSNMKKLRFLKVKNLFDEGPSFLSNELRYIEWPRYPASPFPESFQPTKLAVLKMKDSRQKELWKGYKYLPCLKELELFRAHELVRTPDIGGLPCLQKLELVECGSLEEIHESLGNHKSLVSLNVTHCHKLRRFPRIVGMEKLESLRISECKALVEFPKIEAKMDNLVELYLDNVGIEVLSSSATNLISLALRCCVKLRSIAGNFQALKKLDLYGCGLKDGEIATEIGEFFSLQEINLSRNDFTRLDTSLSRLTRLKLLNLSYCKNLVELPELPSSLAILKADECWSLEEVIRDEIHTKCKWLSYVEIAGSWGKKKRNIIGGERLLKTMLQGNAVESGCMSFHLIGWEIARGFEPGLVEGRRCGMQLPKNWFNDFSGFLFCAASNKYFDGMYASMKHEEEEEEDNCRMGTGDSQHDNDLLHWEEEEDSVDDGSWWYTWVGYIPFSLLRHSSWWDPTSTAISIEIDDYYSIIGCGLKLVPKRGDAESSSSGQMETTPNSCSSEFSLDDDRYKCKFKIGHDSKSALEFDFDRLLN